MTTARDSKGNEIVYVYQDLLAEYLALDKTQTAPATYYDKQAIFAKYITPYFINKDLNINLEESNLPVTLVSEGNLMKENLLISGLKEEDVKNIIKNAKIKRLKDVLVATIDKTGNVYIQEKNKPFQMLKYQYNGGNLT